MAVISTDANYLAILKDYYRPGLESLLLRDDPMLNKIQKIRYSGEKYVFAALAGHGGAVAADFEVSKANSTKTAKNVKFSVGPGQIFSSYTVNSKEVQGTVNERGAFVQVAVDKMAAATDGFRKMMAACFYGNGYGQIGTVASGVTFTPNTAATLTLTSDQVMKLDVDQKLVVLTALNATTPSVTLVVTNIDEVGNSVTVMPDGLAAAYTTAATEYLCFAGSTDPSGNPILPSGIFDWLPIKNARSGATWTAFIGNTFNGVNRSSKPDTLAGSFFYNSSNTTYKADIYGLVKKVRRHCSKAPLVVVNDNDYEAIMAELDTSNRLLTATDTKSKRSTSIGYSGMSASFSTNFIEDIVDTPFMPQGAFLVCDPQSWAMVTLTNAEKAKSDVAGNEPGGATVEQLADGAKDAKDGPWGICIDDYLSIQSGASTWEGPAAIVAIQFFGNYVCLNPAHNGIGLFHNATPANIIGY